jgi:alpha-L-fucosidase
MLVDVVSKNGNLLLNVVQRADGTIDPEAEEMLKEMAAWMAIHGEAIHGTRPWLVYGEGGTHAEGGHFKEDFEYTSADIRFTTKGDTLYAIAMALPADGKLRIKSLAASAGPITALSVLGSSEPATWRQTTDALEVTLPANLPSPHTVALKIHGPATHP